MVGQGGDFHNHLKFFHLSSPYNKKIQINNNNKQFNVNIPPTDLKLLNSTINGSVKVILHNYKFILFNNKRYLIDIRTVIVKSVVIM
ncbi:MAG: hypothetical protein Fur0023_07590 [Bacteroidia bacterium]